MGGLRGGQIRTRQRRGATTWVAYYTDDVVGEIGANGYDEQQAVAILHDKLRAQGITPPVGYDSDPDDGAGMLQTESGRTIGQGS